MAFLEDDDDFFGSQEEDYNNDHYREKEDEQIHQNNIKQFGDLAEKELQSKTNELKNIGFLDGYEDHKETMLQLGFEAGMIETFNIAIRIGELIGEISTIEKLLRNHNHKDDYGNKPNRKPPQPLSPTAAATTEKSKAETTSKVVNEFFSNTFQKGERYESCNDDLEKLEERLRNIKLRGEDEQF
jgi:hypothetical protein